MEVWILLAAAGSGYLMKRLQNSQKLKDSSEDDDDDDEDKNPNAHASDCRTLRSSRGLSPHFSSSSGLLKGKCTKDFSRANFRKRSKDEKKEGKKGTVDREKGHEKDVDMDHETREMEMLGKEHIIDKGIDTLKRGRKKAVDMDIHVLVKDAKDKDMLERETKKKYIELGLSKIVKGENIHDCSNQIPIMRSSKSCGSMDVGSTDDDTFRQGKSDEPESQASSSDTKLNASMKQTSSPASIGLPSGMLANDDNDKRSPKRYMHSSCVCTGNHVKSALDSAAFQAEDSVFGKTWMPGFWDVTEGVFVLDTESLLVQHEFEGRNKGSCSSRRSRTPSKYGKRKMLRKKTTGILKPMSSLESCLSAQMDDYNRKNRKFEESQRGSSSYQNIERDLEEKCTGIRTNDGRTKLSGRDGAVGMPFLSPTRHRPKKTTKSASKKFKKKDHPYASNHGSTHTKGSICSSSGGILFSFGVGVGIMYAIISYMQRTRRLCFLLKEAELLTKDLETDFKKKSECEVKEGVDDVKEGFVVEEERFMNDSLTNVRNVSDLLDTMKMLLSGEADMMHTKDISELEAELVAELDRMELSWDEDNPETERKDSGLTEQLVGEVGSLVQGELKISGLPRDYEEDLKDRSASSHEDLHAHSYVVSPRDLARRLHEVLEARQESRISELESDIELLGRELLKKEQEIEWLKGQKGNRHRHGDDIRMNTSLKHNGGVETENSTPAYTALGGAVLAAYMEACNEFSKAADNLQMRSDKDEADMERGTCEDGLNVVYMENSGEGLEHVDLESLAEDLYINSDPMYMKKMPRAKRSWKRSFFRHPQPEHLICTSRGFDSSDDATNETSESTPCSVKCIDFFPSNKEEKHADCNEEKDADCNEENDADLVINDGQSNYDPDSDGPSGELLIKRIVEKSRKGSHIMRDASLILQSFEHDD